MFRLGLLYLIVVVLLLAGCVADYAGYGAGDAILPPASQTPNLIKNPSFDNPRGFDFWETAGCASYVLPPKPGGAKAGPVKHSGTCAPGDTASIWQSFPVTDTETISFSYYEILKGDSHITVTFDNGAGWEWVARDTAAQSNGIFTPVITSTIPPGTDFLTITIDFHYCPGLILAECGIGSKVSGISATGGIVK